MCDKNSIQLDINFEEIRGIAEQSGKINEYIDNTINISKSLKDISENDNTIKNINLDVYTAPNTKDAHQIIDTITIALASVGGVTGLVKLISMIIDACRTKIQTIYEIEVEGVGKLKVAGPKVTEEQLELLKSMLIDLKDKGNNKKRIKMKAKKINQ